MIQQLKNKNIPNLGIFLAMLDSFIILSASYLSYRYVYVEELLNTTYILSTVLLTAFGILISYLYGVYRYWFGPSMTREIRAVITAWMMTIALMTVLVYALKMGPTFSRTWFGLTVAGAMLIICLSRLLFRQLMKKYKNAIWAKQNIIMIGHYSHAIKIADTISEQSWIDLNVGQIFDSSQDTGEREKGSSSAIVHSIDELDKYLKEYHSYLASGMVPVSQFWIITQDIDEGLIDKLHLALKAYSMDIVYVPDLSFVSDNTGNLTRIAGIPVVLPTTSSLSANQRLVKGLQDYILAFLILAVISPLMLLIAIGVKLSSPGPILYRQPRVTKYAKQFNMLKFRTMPVNTESESGPVWAKSGENRATPFGAFLRRTSLDELPQFINVLRREMSIVGPRPERPEFVEQLKDEIPDYMKKHLIKAGITGWAQVNGYRGDTSLHKRIEYDIFYINHWSLSFDLKIIFMTFYKGFINKSAY